MVLLMTPLLFSTPAEAQTAKPRIGIAGIQIENSVFMPNRQDMVGRPVRMPDYLNADSTRSEELRVGKGCRL